MNLVTITITQDEYNFLAEILSGHKTISSMPAYEIIALNGLREKVGLHRLDGIDDEFISHYSNCHRGCAG